MRRSGLLWFGAIAVGIFLLYLLGIFVRGRYGIAVSVHNVSGETLRDIIVTLEPRGKRYQLGALADAERARTFVEPSTESHVVLHYIGSDGPHVETIVGYVESGYCGKAEVSVLPNHKVISSETIDPVFCKRSWLDFM